METYDVAHIRQDGIDLVIVVVNSNFGGLPFQQQTAAIATLQQCASNAGLAGTVVPVWDVGNGRIGFNAPQTWHAFFQSINLMFVARNINKRLTCS